MSLWPRRFPTIKVANQYAHQPTKIQNYVYASRMGNSNEASGEGSKYAGKCPIQLTGKDNYAAAGKALGIDLVGHPELALQPKYGFRICGWFWVVNKLNDYADQGDVKGATHVINGGYNDLATRETLYANAIKVLTPDTSFTPMTPTNTPMSSPAP